MKKIFSLILALALMTSLCTTAFAASNQEQIANEGGSTVNNDDKVTVSKKISSTECENVFDITLTATMTESIFTITQDPDVAVCIVMDISNTMLEDYGGKNGSTGTTKYQAAIESAHEFVKQFASYTTGDKSRLGFVAFNTNGIEIAPMQPCYTEQRAKTFKDSVESEINSIVNKYIQGKKDNDNEKYTTTEYDYYKNKRYTNIEAGLKMANDMLKACTNQHKFVIFLSDGLPTTYCITTDKNDKEYKGYPPYSGGTVGRDGVFYDRIKGQRCSSGTSYSDKGAVRAREMATAMKQQGVTIYTVGAGLNTFGGTTLSNNYPDWNTDAKKNNLSGEEMIQNQMARAFDKGVSVIDNNFDTISSYNATTINNYKWEICNFEGGKLNSYAPLGTGNLFENWLKYAIGSNAYYDTANATALQNTLTSIFTELSRKVEQSSANLFVVTDPMGPNIEFLGFYPNRLATGSLTDSLTGSSILRGENTAASTTDGFSWDLKKSGWTTATNGSNTMYTYQLTYRVRLKNEAAGKFTEGTEYDTNETTTLTYETIENGEASPVKKINFPIPRVKGYLSELKFDKIDQSDRPVKGAAFQLAHDASNCPKCRDGITDDHVRIDPVTETSGSGGKVSFEKIPSGHRYTLTETKAPDGYYANGDVYYVTVAYDNITATVKHEDGKTEEWDGKSIINTPIYELPSTGGIGIYWYTIGGMLLMMGASLILYKNKCKEVLRR